MRRLFIAIDCHQGIENAAAPVLKKLRINTDQRELEVRWTPVENFHVTLNFLGNTSAEKQAEIEAKMHEVASRHAPFKLKINGMGAFPDEFKARVLWFGVQNSKALRSLQGDLSETMFHRDEHEFVPHLTIARLRNPHSARDLMSPFVRKDLGKVEVKEMILFESIPKGHFSFYKPLVRIPLTGVFYPEPSE